ncbi:coat protein [Lisianthus necrosis virus]|uniref:Capsid protein n=1 Tax=Lisianthus necrosis virus TaxID=334425 RepID=A7M8Y2_9TOMB|nr:coat protein [Lisianthus necrosis virus]
MEIVRRNNNNAIAINKKQLASMAATAAAGALSNYVKNNGAMIVQGAVNMGKKAYGAVRNRRNKGNSQAMVHVGGMGGAMMAPVAVSRQLVGSKPKFAGRTAGSVTVTHREYLTQVNNSPAFTTNGGIVGNLLQLNPLNGTLFSWLPAIASNFDQYVFNSVMLHYVPLCGTNEVGRVAMYWDKDSEDPEPVDRVELANFGILKETAPWAEAILRVPTDKTKRYCDDSTVVDRKLIDLGQLGISTYGGTGTNPVGDVFVSYSVTLYFPQPTNTLLSTRQLNLTGALEASTGPGYINVTRTPTLLTITFRSTGTFLLSGVFRDTSVAVLGVAGGIGINSQTTLDVVGVATSFLVNCTVSTLPATLTYGSAGITSVTANCTRATRANTATLL